MLLTWFLNKEVNWLELLTKSLWMESGTVSAKGQNPF